MPSLHPYKGGDFACGMDALYVFGTIRHLEVIRILLHEAAHKINLLHRGFGSAFSSPFVGDINRPELPADLSCPQTWDICFHSRINGRCVGGEINGRYVAIMFFAIAPGGIIVAINKRCFAEEVSHLRNQFGVGYSPRFRPGIWVAHFFSLLQGSDTSFALCHLIIYPYGT